MNKETIIDKTICYVKETLAGAEGGHDWWHIYRVWSLSKHIAKTERADLFIVELGALLHDIADSKFHDGDEEIGPQKADDFLKTQDVEDSIVTHVENIIRHISFKGGRQVQLFKSPELDVIQDADRLDAMGAIGIARTFNYGGHKNREMYNPAVKPDLNKTNEEYKKKKRAYNQSFYEKLLLLKDRMNTKTGKLMAEQRHKFMVQFLDQFYKEWKAEF